MGTESFEVDRSFKRPRATRQDAEALGPALAEWQSRTVCSAKRPAQRLTQWVPGSTRPLIMLPSTPRSISEAVR